MLPHLLVCSGPACHELRMAAAFTVFAAAQNTNCHYEQSEEAAFRLGISGGLAHVAHAS